ERLADAPQLVDAARRLDENAVGAGLDVALGAAHGLVEVVDLAGVGARQDPGFRIEPLRARGPDLGFGQFDRHHLLAGHMAAALGPLLVLDQDRADAHTLVALHGVHHFLAVAVAVVAVDEHRQVARRHDVAHAGGDLTKALEPDIGHA